MLKGCSHTLKTPRPTGGGGVGTHTSPLIAIAKKTAALRAVVFCIAVRTTLPQLS